MKRNKEILEIHAIPNPIIIQNIFKKNKSNFLDVQIINKISVIKTVSSNALEYDKALIHIIIVSSAHKTLTGKLNLGANTTSTIKKAKVIMINKRSMLFQKST